MPGFPSQLSQSLAQNWASVTITFLISLFSVYGTKKIIEGYLSSATDERRSQAKSDLLDVLENHVINEKDISSDKMAHLMSAIDRKHSVNLSDKLSKVELLQDIELRIEESSHLDSTQKEEYSETIEGTIAEIKAQNESPEYYYPVPHHMKASLINTLQDELEQDNIEEALNILNRYEDEMKARETQVSEAQFNSPQDIVLAIIAWTFLFAVLYMSALGVSELLNLNLLPASFNPLLWGSILTMIIVLGYYAYKY